MSGDRNAGLPSGLRAHSQRARARAADRATADQLRNDEWSVHHLVGIQPAKAHLALLTAATRAGWAMDAAANLMILPRNEAAQAKLAAVGIHRPVHNSGHAEWNWEVNAELQSIEIALNSLGYAKRSIAYARLARQLLENLQIELRGRAMSRNRISEYQPPIDPSRGVTISSGVPA